MIVQWDDQLQYIYNFLNCGWSMATTVVLYNMIGQLAGVLMVLARFRVNYACGILLSIVIFQVS